MRKGKRKEVSKEVFKTCEHRVKGKWTSAKNRATFTLYYGKYISRLVLIPSGIKRH